VSRGVARAIAVSIFVFSVLAIAVSTPIGIAVRDRVEPGRIVVVGDPASPRMAEIVDDLERERDHGATFTGAAGGFNEGFALLLLFVLVWLGVGVLIVWRQPTHWAGWLFVITGVGFPLISLSQSLVLYGLKVEPGSVPLVGLWAFVGEYALYPVALVPLLFLLYPDGHPPSRRWRWAAIALIGGTALAIVAFLLRPGPMNNWIEAGIAYENPLGVAAFENLGPALILVGAATALIAAFSTVFAVRQRFKRSTGEDRQRMRWIAYVAFLAGTLFGLQWTLGIVLSLLGFDSLDPFFNTLFGATALTLAVGVPAAYLIAIFRYGLWNLDVVVKKTVQYGLLVALFTGLVGLVLFLASSLIVGAGGTLEVGPILLVAVVLAVGFNLLRSRARRWANRIVYGKRSTPYEVLSEFSDRVGGSYSIDDVLPRMAQLLGEATGANTTRVWLRHGDELRADVSWPTNAPPATPRPVVDDELPELGEDAFEVRHQGELLGALTLSPAPNDPMTPTKEQLARDMAAQAGLVLRNVALIADVRESRRRIVTAQDERARALERNIHDGAQQQLVALSVKLRLAQQLVDRDPGKAQEMLVELQTQTNETLEDLRDLARGIYPPLLADQGLAAALEAQGRRSSLAVAVHPDGVGRYGQDIESAVYFCCLEALNNAAKYAEAANVEIRLTTLDGELRFEVRDDGRGFDQTLTTFGTGLQGMADRLDAIGGSIEVVSTPGEGTTVVGKLPAEEASR
jgi:signal transduction histidine kinase